jgi:hypothetical protein
VRGIERCPKSTVFVLPVALKDFKVVAVIELGFLGGHGVGMRLAYAGLRKRFLFAPSAAYLCRSFHPSGA